jgi:hypothetical protein
MYNAHSRLLHFEGKHVRVLKDERAKLAVYRERNLDRLKEGLEKIGPMRGASKAAYDRPCDQGGYAMYTLVQRPQGDYDIDTAVIFREDALPADPLAARKRVAEALQKSAAQFKMPPEVRTNAVTVCRLRMDEARSRRDFEVVHGAGPSTQPPEVCRRCDARTSDAPDRALPEGVRVLA